MQSNVDAILNEAHRTRAQVAQTFAKRDARARARSVGLMNAIWDSLDDDDEDEDEKHKRDCSTNATKPANSVGRGEVTVNRATSGSQNMRATNKPLQRRSLGSSTPSTPKSASGTRPAITQPQSARVASTSRGRTTPRSELAKTPSKPAPVQSARTQPSRRIAYAADRFDGNAAVSGSPRKAPLSARSPSSTSVQRRQSTTPSRRSFTSPQSPQSTPKGGGVFVARACDVMLKLRVVVAAHDGEPASSHIFRVRVERAIGLLALRDEIQNCYHGVCASDRAAAVADSSANNHTKPTVRLVRLVYVDDDGDECVIINEQQLSIALKVGAGSERRMTATIVPSHRVPTSNHIGEQANSTNGQSMSPRTAALGDVMEIEQIILDLSHQVKAAIISVVEAEIGSFEFDARAVDTWQRRISQLCREQVDRVVSQDSVAHLRFQWLCSAMVFATVLLGDRDLYQGVSSTLQKKRMDGCVVNVQYHSPGGVAAVVDFVLFRMAM